MVSNKYQGQNYKVNNKIKKAVDKNQLNYRESEDDPIPFIKRVYVYITDKKGKILENVTLKFQDKEIFVGRNGLLITNFPNESTEITAEKDGYKSATGNVILNAEIQTHEFFLALSTSDEESEVISTDNTKEPEDESGLQEGEVLFNPPLDGTDGITSWSGTNKTENGIYTCHGSFLTEGWSNEGLWQLEYDIAYSGSGHGINFGYVGAMPICSEEIKPFTDEKNKTYSLTAWEGYALIYGLESTAVGPTNYKYLNREEYHHAVLKKVAEDKLEYSFDGREWVITAPNLKNLTTLHIGARDNPASRSVGENIYYKNIKVTSLTSSKQETNTSNSTEEELEGGSENPANPVNPENPENPNTEE